MKILFLHGWNSAVGGVKPTFLRNFGHTVLNPSLDHNDFPTAVAQAQQVFDLQQPDVVVGSSRGGAVAMNLANDRIPLVLLCPAWKNWGTANSIAPNSIVLHSPNDEIIPFADSVELLRNSRLPAEALLEVGNDHRLADEEPLAVMLWSCELLCSGQTLPWLDPTSARREAVNASGSVSDCEATYVCDACGEEIVVPVDLSEGNRQTYVEDCPVCCRANLISIQLDDDGLLQISAEPEQDRD